MDLNHTFRILVIDDNPAIHEDFRKILAVNTIETNLQEHELALFEQTEKKIDTTEYFIDSAYQGEEGLKLIQKSIQTNQPYAVMFVDVRMPPGWDGIETIAEIWKIESKIQTVICTAYSDYSWEDMYSKFGNTDRLLILKKPFDNIEVRQIAITLCKKWLLSKQLQQQLDTLQTTVDEQMHDLRNSFSLLRATFESTADGILVTNMRDKVLDFNNNFLKLWNIPEDIMSTCKFSNLLGLMISQLEDPGVFLKRIQKFYTHSAEKSFDLLKFKNKKIFECLSQPQIINGEIIGRVWDFRDITKRRQLEEQLAYQAGHDILTGLYNRSLLMKQVDIGLEEAKKKKAKAAILFFDLDNFKLINDSLGHSIGDKVLQLVAARMKQCVKSSDTLSRLGGDEFVTFVSALINEQDIINIIKRFFDLFTKPFNVDGNILNITVSAGISVFPRDGDIAEILFKSADAAMYRAKEMGRNNFQFYTASMNQLSADHLKLSNDLNLALENHELLLNYQPLLDLKTKHIIGVEALIRWQHPTRGLILPVEFIPIAEETGLIVPIGEWVLKTACKQIKAWHDRGLPLVWVAVNLSVIQFKRGDIIKSVDQALTESGLDPSYLCLEITESLVLEDTEELRVILMQLKDRGITLAIDDFGVGYSNLNYITKFPIDKLKIDKSFMRDVVADPNEAAVVLAILGIARGLNMKVLAEGVETQEQLNFLQTNECDEFQGFLVSEPIDATACGIMLQQSSDANKKNE